MNVLFTQNQYSYLGGNLMKIIFTQFTTPCTPKGFIHAEISEIDICLGKSFVRIKETLSKDEPTESRAMLDTIDSVVNMFLDANEEERDRLDFELDIAIDFYSSRYKNVEDSGILVFLGKVSNTLDKIKEEKDDWD